VPNILSIYQEWSIILRNAALCLTWLKKPSSRGNNLNLKFTTIVRAHSFLPANTIVDGELVVLDENGKPSFSALHKSRFTPDSLYFYVFDLLAYQQKDVRKLPLVDRLALLENDALKALRDPVRLSEVFDISPQQLVAAARRSGLEGIIAKRADSRYESAGSNIFGRSRALWRMRNGQTHSPVAQFNAQANHACMVGCCSQ
jgi:hypothetical protein